MKETSLFLAAVLLLSQCSVFEPVPLEYDEDKENKEPRQDYRDGELLPRIN